MRLDKIKLVGFKSFVDATTVHFPGNLTGIVGHMAVANPILLMQFAGSWAKALPSNFVANASPTLF